MKRTVVLAAALVVGAGAQAHADKRVKLFPLSSTGLPKSLRSAPPELTRVLARSLGAETTTVPIEDAAELMECSLTQKSCLESIAGSVGVKHIVFGKLESRDGGAVIKLTSYEVGKGESTRSISISGDTTDDMTTSLEDAIDAASRPAKTDEPSVITPDPPTVTDGDGGGVTTGTWAMIIGGGVTAGIGLGLIVSTNGLRREAATTPTATAEDIRYLRSIERAGQQRLQIGGAMTAIGGVVATIGIIRMVIQKRSPRPKQETEPRLDLVPEAGGASVRFTMGWR